MRKQQMTGYVSRLGLFWVTLGVMIFALKTVAGETLPASPTFKIVTSIKPLELIVSDVLALAPHTDIEVVSLLPVNADPHHYALKVSDRKALADADLVLWIGPEMERFLTKVMSQLPENRQIQVESVAGITWPMVEEGHHYDDGHGHEGYDPHFWLNPENVQQLQRVLLQWLTSNVGVEVNAQALNQKWDQLTAKLQQRMLPLKSMHYGVYHDGFRHFTQFFGLEPPYIVSPGGEQAPSARHIFLLQQQLQQANCLLVEPGVMNAMVMRLHASTEIALQPVDILGVNAPGSIAELIDRVAEAFEHCYQAGKGAKK